MSLFDPNNDTFLFEQCFYDDIEVNTFSNAPITFLFFFHPQDNDKIKGGLTLERYQDLYGDFLGNPDRNPGCYLFGPLAGDE